MADLVEGTSKSWPTGAADKKDYSVKVPMSDFGLSFINESNNEDEVNDNNESTSTPISFTINSISF